MNWETLRADEYCIAVKDGTHDTPKPVDFGYKLVTGKHVKNGQIDSSSAYYISEEDYNAINKRSMVERWDVIMSMIGTVGEAAVVKNDPDYAIKNVALFKCGGSEVRGKWLCYYLNSPEGKGKMLGEMKGSSQQFLSLKQLRELPIMFSEEKVPRIVEIISNYDDLIENNQKQIKLLEEAAQRLYKEWFVDLNFPGHENTKIVDGVPEGWRISSIYDVFDIKYGKNLPTSKITKTGQYPVYGASGVIGYYNEKNCDDYATLVTSRGNGSGDVFRTHHKQSYITNNSFIARRNDKNSFIENEFTFQLFSNTDFKKLCTGSAQPQLTNTSIQKIKILLPNRQLIEKYQRCTIEMSEKQEALYQEQRALTQARNRLLPKLMNGTVEV